MASAFSLSAFCSATPGAVRELFLFATAIQDLLPSGIKGLVLTGMPAALASTDAEWLRLLLMSSISTVIVVIATLSTKPTNPDLLADYYRKTRPPGFWRRSAARIGQDHHTPVAALKKGLYLAVTTSLSIYLLLYGISRLLLPLPDGSAVFAIFAIIMGLGAIFLWWRRLRLTSAVRD